MAFGKENCLLYILFHRYYMGLSIMERAQYSLKVNGDINNKSELQNLIERAHVILTSSDRNMIYLSPSIGISLFGIILLF